MRRIPIGNAASAIALCLAIATSPAMAQRHDTLPSDLVPDYHVPAAPQGDLIRREVMIPMRDGVKLYTLIVMKKGATDAPAADRPYVDDGYIRAWQDVRGRNRSEGTYFTIRPLSGPLNPTGIDHATDAYDTIEWLIHHVPEANGRVGAIGGSYDGFTALMATMSGHPALKAAVPINPMVGV